MSFTWEVWAKSLRVTCQWCHSALRPHRHKAYLFLNVTYLNGHKWSGKEHMPLSQKSQYSFLHHHSNGFGTVWTWECGVSQRCPHSSVKWDNNIFFVVVLAGLTMYFVTVQSQVFRRLKETRTLHCKIHNLYVDRNKEQRLVLIFWAWLLLTSLAKDWPPRVLCLLGKRSTQSLSITSQPRYAPLKGKL